MPYEDIRQSSRESDFTDSFDDNCHTPARYNPLHLPDSMGIPFEMRVSGYWKYSPDRCATPRCHLCAKSVEENQRRTSGDPAPSIYETLYRRVNPKFVVCFCSCVLVFWAAKRWTTVYGAS